MKPLFTLSKLLLALTVVLLVSLSANAQKIPFQGKLLENGEPVTGTKSLVFSIADPAWSETHENVQVSNGLYSLVLGSITDLPAGLFNGVESLSLNVSVDGTALTPVEIYAPMTGMQNEYNATYDPNDTEAKPALSGFADGTPYGYDNNGTPSDPSDDINVQAVAIRGTAESNGANTGVEGIANHSAGNGEFQVGVYGKAGGDGEGIKYGLRGDLSGSNSGFTVAVRGLNAAAGVQDGVSYGGWFDTRGTGASGMTNYGVRGTANKNAGKNIGVYGSAFNGDSNYAGWFDGDIQVFGENFLMAGRDWENTPGLPIFELRGTVQSQPDGNGNTYSLPAFGVNVQNDGTEQWADLSFQIQDVNGSYDRPMANLRYNDQTGTGLLQMYSNSVIEFTNDNGTPNDESDDFPDSYYNNAVNLGVDGDGMGYLDLQDDNGGYFRIDANGLGGDLSASKAEGEFRVESDGQGRAFIHASYDEGQDLRWGGMNLNSPSDLDNIRFGYKTWETNKELPYFRINGDQELVGDPCDHDGDPNTPDQPCNYRPDLVWMNVAQWDDNGTPTEQVGEISFRSTSGADFGMNAYGLTGISNDLEARNIHIRSNRYNTNDGNGGSYPSYVGSFNIHEWGDDPNTTDVTEPNQDVAHLNLEAIDANGDVISSFGMNAYGFTRNLENLGVNGNIDLGNVYDPNESGVQVSSNGNVVGNYFEILGTQQVPGDPDNYLPGLVSIGYDNQANNGNAGWLALRHSNNGANEVESIRLNGDNGSIWSNGELSSPYLSIFGNQDVPDGEGGSYLPALAAMGFNEGVTNGNAGWLALRNSNNGNEEVVTIYMDGDNGSAQFSGNLNVAGSIMGSINDSEVFLGTDEGLGEDFGKLSLFQAGGAAETIRLAGNDGSARFDGNVQVLSLTETSDQRLKTNILPLNNALDNVLSMRGVSYNWLDKDKSQANQIGVIAQEVEEVYPEFVHTNEEGMKSVNYSQMVAVLIEAIKELNTKITTLETENASLKASLAEVDGLKSQMKNLETLVAKLVQNDAVTTTTQQQ